MNASLALWLNVATNSFANGPFDPSDFFAPLGLIQNQQLTIDIYFVTPSGSEESPWIYNDPTSYLTAAGLSVANRYTYVLYNSTSGFTRLSDGYGPKARFTLNITANQLNSDLLSQASIISLLQATWSTSTSSPSAQLPAVINKIASSSSPPPAVLPNPFTLNEHLPLGAYTAYFDYTSYGLEAPPTNVIWSLIKSNGNNSNISIYPRSWSATTAGADLSSPTDDTTYIAVITVMP